MKKYYCDKCGLELNPLIEKYTLKIDGPNFIFECADFDGAPVHLCPTCMVKFYKWLEGKDERQ